MPETAGGGAEIPYIELPSALRIRQRLGMLATRQPSSYGQELVPSIARLGGESRSSEEFVAELEILTADYAENHRLGMVRHVQAGIPKIIDKLIDDPLQKDAALEAWEILKADIIEEDDRTDQKLRQRYQPRTSRHQTRRAKRRGRS